MALTDSEGMGTTMLVQPTGAMNGFGNGFGGDGWWILLLFILLGGNNGFGGNGFGGNGLYPWMNQSNQIADGFYDQMLNNNISGIRSDINSLQNAITDGQFAALTQNYGIQSALQNCCCENRQSIADLKYTVATENCADRAALSDALRDVLTAQTASTQRILDQMCADKIDAKNEKIADLERQLTLANLAASQRTQTQTLLADNAAQTTALEQYLAPVPRPAYIVQNPNCCYNNNGCGCGV